MVLVDAEGVPVVAKFGGPPVAACFDCDQAIPLGYISWYGELSEKGRVVALLPYCDRCRRLRDGKTGITQG